LLADRSKIDYDTKTRFINSGVIHVLAVSGLHVGFIAVVFIFLFGRFNIYLRSFLTIAGLLAFMFITGVPPPVFRATLMAVIIIIAFMLNRSTNLFNSLALAALIILFIDPEQLYNPGFQLSFSAVLGIALVFPPLERVIKKINFNPKLISYILLFMTVSFAAQIGTLPFTLIYFGKLSVVALIANMFVIPLIAVIVGLGIFTLILTILLPFLAEFSATANDLFTSLLFFIVRTSGGFEYSFIRIRDFSVIDALLFYIILIFTIFYLKKFKSFTAKSAIIVLAAANFYIFSSLDNKNFFSDNKLSVFAIDVGQGDAILIRFPGGETALIDAGDATPFFDNGERVILPLLDYLDIKQVDYAFVSHLDSDHYGGFVSLIHAGKIKTIYKPPLDTSLSKDIKFEKFIVENDVRLNYYKKEIIDIGGVRIYTLNHPEDFSSQGYSTNDKSGVKKLVYGNTSFLFTGDIERKVETVFASRYKDFLKSDVLKAAHHGSKTSSTPQFVNYVSPSISIISAGIMNRFNHPSPEVVARLKSIGSEIYRTDKYGALLFESDGESITFSDWRGIFN
jgi:competence protein ComEC